MIKLMAEQHDEILSYVNEATNVTFQNEQTLIHNQQVLAYLILDLNKLLFFQFIFLLLISISVSYILYYIQKVEEKMDDNVMVADGHYVKA